MPSRYPTPHQVRRTATVELIDVGGSGLFELTGVVHRTHGGRGGVESIVCATILLRHGLYVPVEFARMDPITRVSLEQSIRRVADCIG